MADLRGGIGNGLRDRAETQRLGGGDGFGIDDGLLVLQVFIEREQEAGALALADGSGD